MKLYKISLLALASIAFTACEDIDELKPVSGRLTEEQVQDVYKAVPSRIDATFTGMFSMMGHGNSVLSSDRADDFGFIMSAISLDTEGPDYIYPNSGYNWFSVCGQYTSRYADYANPYIRYGIVYNQIKIANDVIKSYPADTKDPTAINNIAQARAIRAFDYLSLVQYFQYNYNKMVNGKQGKDLPSIPLVTESTADFSNNPRATVEDVFKQIMSDLDYAIENLRGYKRPTNAEKIENKALVNQNVAFGLRARANLIMGNYAEAAADADSAAVGYKPYSMSAVSTPAFCSLKDANWIWGIDVTQQMTNDYGRYPTPASWVSSFSGWGYAAGAGCYAHINKMLYDKIEDTDVRKGWWVNEKLESPLLSTISWDGISGNAISKYEIDDTKMPFDPYTNVKFGMASGIGAIVNDNDWPLMRVEEMILIKVEGLAKSGKEGEARTLLENFVKSYRNPAYSVAKATQNRTFADEIWFQRRVELWGEGFAMSDIMRLNKPVVRFHGDDRANSNEPDAFKFNISPDDPWLLLRFPQTELDTNKGVIDNEGGTAPEMYQNGELRDGVTD